MMLLKHTDRKRMRIFAIPIQHLLFNVKSRLSKLSNLASSNKVTSYLPDTCFRDLFYSQTHFLSGDIFAL